MLGTLIGAALPIVTAVVGVGVGVTASLAFSGVVDMASVTPVLGVMLGLAVGIDYSLFIVNRHRKQLLNGVPVRSPSASPPAPRAPPSCSPAPRSSSLCSPST